jgi:hypothetical protein
MYADAGASATEIRQRFGISDPTLYRVLLKQNIPLRRRGTRAADPRKVVDQESASRESARRRQTSAAQPTRAPQLARLDAGSADTGETSFVVEFRAERVFDAVGILDALHQAESTGAHDIVSIRRVA